jgi:predicted nuclease of restriction endonuclease-like (RecB) superfamily
MEATPIKINGINELVDSIQHVNKHFLRQTQRQVNIALTLRNWVIGCFVFEYEQRGKDRADYGQRLYKAIAEKLKSNGFMSLGWRNLYQCKDFYVTYPNILQTVSAKLYLLGFEEIELVRTVSAQLLNTVQPAENPQFKEPNLLLEKLSFSHFIELMKAETSVKRSFYECQVINNNWSIRELKRAMNSLLYERTGSVNTALIIPPTKIPATDLKAEEVFRNPYLLEFLGLEGKSSYTETDLEAAIITNLQAFLLELGRGFCFEARQKRITFGNRHYRIDLVFYHRILKCHVLIDLKMDEFEHADAGQMNVYLNYYKENEVQKGDNPPIGIILCTSKDEALVKYATMGLSQKVFVSKYLTNLPSETELQTFLLAGRGRLDV